MGEQQDRQNRLMLDRALERAGRQPQFGTPAQRPDPLFPVGRAVTPRPAYEQFFDMPLADIPARTQEDIDAAEAFDLYAEREAQHRAERLAQGPLGAIAAPVTDWLTSPEARERMGEGVSHWLDGFTGGGSGARGEPDDTNTLGEIGDAFGDAARGAIRAPNPILAAPAVAAGASRVADAVSDWWSEDDNQLSLPWRMGGAQSLFSIQPGAEGGPLQGYVPAFGEAATGASWEESDWARRGLQFENARIDAATNNGQGPIAVDTSARDLYADEMTASGIDAALNLGFGVLDASEVLRAPRLLGASNDLAGEIAFYRSPDGFAETSIDPDGRIVHTYQGGYQSGEGSAGEAVASMRAAERALLDDIGQNQRPEYYWRPGPDDGGDPRLAQFYRNAFERRTPPGYTFSEAPDGTMRLARNAEAPADPTLQRPAEDSMLPAFDDDVWYHGTTEDFDSFDGATWITRNPERASTYALERDEDWLGANVRPLSTRGRVHQFPPDREKHTIPRREMNVYRDLGYDAVEMLSADGSIDRLVFDPANLAPRYGRPASESLDNTPLLSQAAPWLVGAGGGGAVGYILSGEADADDGEVDDDGFPLLPALGAGAGLTAAYLATRGRGGPARVLDESQSPAEPTRLYRGIVPDESRRSALGDRWWSTDPGVASSYAPDGVDGAYVMFGDIDENALNLLNVEPEPGTMFRSIPVETLTPDLRAAFPRSSETVSTHEIAAAAESLGYDGVTFRGIRDSGYGGAGEAYPGFGEGDPGRVVALFDDQAFDARSAPDGASPSDWRQSVIPLGVGAAAGGALLLGDDAKAQDMSAEEALDAYGAESDYFGPGYRLVAPRGQIPGLDGADIIDVNDDQAVMRAGGRLFLVRVAREAGGGADMGPASLQIQMIGELEPNPDAGSYSRAGRVEEPAPAEDDGNDWLAARPLLSIGAGLAASRLTRNRGAGAVFGGGVAALSDAAMGGEDAEPMLAGLGAFGARHFIGNTSDGMQVERALRSPEFAARRDAFALTLGDETPILRGQNTFGEVPMGAGGLSLEPPRAEAAEQGYARPIERGASAYDQFMALTPEDQLWWMDSADARVADQSALLDDVRAERAALGMDDAFRVAPVLPAGDALRAALAPNDSRSFPIGFFDPATGEALFGSAGRRGPPPRPRKPFDQLAPAGQARRIGGAPDQIALAQELGLGEFQKGAEAMRAIRERAAADPAFMEMLKTRFPSIAAAILGVGGAVASEVADEGDWLR